MPGGRPAKPTNLKLLHGDHKKNPKRVNRAEPVPGSLPVQPPHPLSAEAQEVWDRLAPDMIRTGVLTAWDVDAFALFCEAVVITRSKVQPAREEWTPQPGTASPLSELKQAVGIVATLGGQFGWTPAARTKLAVGGEQRGDAKERLLS